MTLWIALAAMTALAVTGFVWGLRRRSAVAASRAEFEMVVYRDQLAAVRRDVEQGVLSMTEAEAVEAEISRRILSLERSQGTRDTASEGVSGREARVLAAAVLVVFVSVGAFGLYMVLCSPERAGAPEIDRQTVAVTDSWNADQACGQKNSGRFRTRRRCPAC